MLPFVLTDTLVVAYGVRNYRPCDCCEQDMHLCCERVKWLRIGFCDVHEVGSSYFGSGEYDHFVSRI